MLIKFSCVLLLTAALLMPALVNADNRKSADPQIPAAAAEEEQAQSSDDGKLHGRLPQFYSKLDVSTEQRQRIYKIQALYAAKTDALQKQLQELKAQCNAESRTVLTADQKAKLDELVDERKSKKTKDVKPADTKSTAAGNNKVSESAAK